MSTLRISVVTVCYNSNATIGNTLESVASQTYEPIEQIVVDGGSTDGTLEIIKRYGTSIAKWVSEQDQGIYDAMNKGIELATGDVVGFLNSDDIYAHPDVLARVAETFRKYDIEACYGDLVFVRDDMRTIVRYYRSSKFMPERLAYGWMPAHPTLFLKRGMFDKYGVFKTDYQIAADYELVTRLFWKHQIRYKYIPKVLVKMRMGGVSTRGIKSNYILSKEIVRACRENGINTSLPKVLLKYPQKVIELFSRPI